MCGKCARLKEKVPPPESPFHNYFKIAGFHPYDRYSYCWGRSVRTLNRSPFETKGCSTPYFWARDGQLDFAYAQRHVIEVGRFRFEHFGPQWRLHAGAVLR